MFNGPYSVSLCKYIERDWKNFLCFIKCGVGDRTKLKFWYYKWHCDIPSKEAFPKLFCLTRNREALVVDCMQFCNDTVYWALNFIATVTSRLGVRILIVFLGYDLPNFSER